jgi:hypothetical protein
MKGDAIPDPDHILRYVGGSHVDQSETGQPVVLGGGFIAKPRDNNSPSYNWLEYLKGTLLEQVAQVRASSRLSYGTKGKLVRLNVGTVRGHIKSNTEDQREVEVLHDPLEAEDDLSADPSHALMINVPDEDDPSGELVGDLISQCILEIFPAVGRRLERTALV